MCVVLLSRNRKILQGEIVRQKTRKVAPRSQDAVIIHFAFIYLILLLTFTSLFRFLSFFFVIYIHLSLKNAKSRKRIPQRHWETHQSQRPPEIALLVRNVCEIIYRDANGFKCYLASESHLRLMILFSDNAKSIVRQKSNEFEKLFLDTLRLRHSTVIMNANNLYQEIFATSNTFT